MIVWRIEGKIIRTVLCCVVYSSCTQCTHTRAVLKDECWFRFKFSFACVCLDFYMILCVFLV